MKRALAIGTSVLVIVALGYGVHEMLRVPSHSTDPTAPLTDVAGKSRRPEVRSNELPLQRETAGDGAASATPEAPSEPVVLPRLMPDVEHPPQWTEPRAVPPVPTPPDPFVPPPVAVDPSRGHHTNAE